MLRINLSTRPFYNERGIHLVLALLGIAAVGVLVVGIARLAGLSRGNVLLTAEAERNEQAVNAVAEQTITFRRGATEVELQRLADAAREANRLISQRIFSWTEFFNRIEQTLPANVMLTSVRPDIEPGKLNVAIEIIGRRVPDIGSFIEQMEATGAFTDVLAREEEMTKEGSYRALLSAQYLPSPVEMASAASEVPTQ